MAAPARAPRHNQWTRTKMAMFLRELAASQSVQQAADSVGMSRQSAYRLRNRLVGTPFALAWEVALEAGLQQLAHTLMDRALNGTEEPQYYHGELVGMRRRYDNRLAAWLLDNPWKVGRHQMAREYAAEGWDDLLDRIEAGGNRWDGGEEHEAAIAAMLDEDEREGQGDPINRAGAASWYAAHPPASRRGRSR